ncbi:DUF6378 domain-containing protein [Mycobacterium sp. Root265]|uniref:DUF6378 domain-containing protein n=1 Tax=Mycobacterium sp. Root265 TaxID=1736504 RepID=UPI000A8D0D88|nr:DUF6378 domain-containing protein [Mycobacterium sp. Root265]
MTDNVLQEAEKLIFGDREETYGDPSESFARIANLWTAYIGKLIEPQDVANLMILLKVSRTKGTFHRDSFVDIGGYAGLAERLHKADSTPAPVGRIARRYDSLTSAATFLTLQDRQGLLWKKVRAGQDKLWCRHNMSGRVIATKPYMSKEYDHLGPFVEVIG